MRIRITPSGRNFAGAFFRISCITIIIASVLWLFNDDGLLSAFAAWTIAEVHDTHLSRLNLQVAGICLPLILLLFVTRKGLLKKLVIAAMICFVIVWILNAIIHAGESALNAVAQYGRDQAKLRLQHSAPPPDSRPDLKMDPDFFTRLNPMNDIPARPDLVRFNIPRNSPNSDQQVGNGNGRSQP